MTLKSSTQRVVQALLELQLRQPTRVLLTLHKSEIMFLLWGLVTAGVGSILEIPKNISVLFVGNSLTYVNVSHPNIQTHSNQALISRFLCCTELGRLTKCVVYRIYQDLLQSSRSPKDPSN